MNGAELSRVSDHYDSELTQYLRDSAGRRVITLSDGSTTTISPEVFSQFGVEVVQETDGTVGFRNADGKYLAANMDWTDKSSSSLEHVFSPEIEGELQAFRSSESWEYLTIRDDGTLQMMPTSGVVSEAQKFQGLRGENINIEEERRGFSDNFQKYQAAKLDIKPLAVT